MTPRDPSEPDDGPEPESPSPDHPSYVPTQIGPYKLRETLGEGGMGVVYGAEQTEPVKREVALKVIKLGMDTKEIVARFEAERQALAVMEHPSIAKVFDAGATDTGQPYFVMELVRGTPIVDYCDQRRLTIRERVRLFVQVCLAVQHAHLLGLSLTRIGSMSEGFRHLDGAVRDLSELARLDPTNSSLPGSLGRTLGLRAQARLASGAMEAAREDVDRMVPLLSDAYRAVPEDVLTRVGLAGGLTLSGDIHTAVGDPQAAEAAWIGAVDVLGSASAISSDWREASALAFALQRLGRTAEAQPLLDRLANQGVHLTSAERPTTNR